MSVARVGPPGRVVKIADNAAKVIRAGSSAVKVVKVGTQGPPGASGGAFFTHTQSAPSGEWIVNHNLGFEPNVQVRTVGGLVIGASVRHMSLTQLRVYVNPPVAGTARCV